MFKNKLSQKVQNWLTISDINKKIFGFAGWSSAQTFCWNIVGRQLSALLETALLKTRGIKQEILHLTSNDYHCKIKFKHGHRLVSKYLRGLLNSAKKR